MKKIIIALVILIAFVSCDDKKTGLEDKLVAAINADKIKDVKIELSKETFEKSTENYTNFEAFIDARLNKNIDKLGRTPLVWASMINMSTLERTKESEKIRLEIVKYLLDNGADCNIKDKNGWTPLFWASWSGMDEIAALLIDQCPVVNDATDKQWTPLMAASMKGWNNVVELLLKKGADTELKNNEGHTALDLAKHNFKVYPEFSVRLKKTIDILENGVKEEVKETVPETAGKAEEADKDKETTDSDTETADTEKAEKVEEEKKEEAAPAEEKK